MAHGEAPFDSAETCDDEVARRQSPAADGAVFTNPAGCVVVSDFGAGDRPDPHFLPGDRSCLEAEGLPKSRAWVWRRFKVEVSPPWN